MWRLKASENEFQVTREGKFEYHHFKHGEAYSEIPSEEAKRFEEIGAETEILKKKKGLRPGGAYAPEGGEEK